MILLPEYLAEESMLPMLISGEFLHCPFNFTVLPADFVFVRISSKKLSERGSSMASLNRSDADAWSLNKRERNMTRTSCVDFGMCEYGKILKMAFDTVASFKIVRCDTFTYK